MTDVVPNVLLLSFILGVVVGAIFTGVVCIISLEL
jgi:hypothetical protein